MKVLLLSPYPEMLTHALEEAGDTVMDMYEYTAYGADFIVSFGNRSIVKDPMLSQNKDRIINIHIGFLPWNRGADPNFWSWFDDTPKGVTIHQIDEGIDTGGILVQEEIKKWRRDETLHSSWHLLMARAKALFESEWKNIRRGSLPTRKPDKGTGSYHRSADKERWLPGPAVDWTELPVKEVARMGREFRASQHEKEDRRPRPRKYRQQAFKEF